VPDAIDDAAARLGAIAELARLASDSAAAQASALLHGSDGERIASELMAGVASRLDALRLEADGIRRLLDQANAGLRPSAEPSRGEAVSNGTAQPFRSRRAETSEDRGLRLIATQMLARGEGRMAIASALKQRFDLDDPVAVVDEVMSSIGTAAG
jgi:hypothetical protein